MFCQEVEQLLTFKCFRQYIQIYIHTYINTYKPWKLSFALIKSTSCKASKDHSRGYYSEFPNQNLNFDFKNGDHLAILQQSVFNWKLVFNCSVFNATTFENSMH